jgi:hypothetical protein
MEDEKLPKGTTLRAERDVGSSTVTLTLQPRAVKTDDQALWVAIQNRTEAINFDHYQHFIDRLLCEGKTDPEHHQWPSACEGDHNSVPTLEHEEKRSASQFGSPHVSTRREELERRPDIYGIDSYDLLKLATRAFLTFEAGVVIYERTPDGKLALDSSKPIDEDRLYRTASMQEMHHELEHYLTRVGDGHGKALPYLKLIVRNLLTLRGTTEVIPYCEGILRHRFHCPSMLELIWSYWLEEGMLVQTMNAISLRFQNKRSSHNDPLANFELDPLRPLNNLLWGFVQDEFNRLTVSRRAYEYEHQYGLSLLGKAIPRLRAADRRSKFIEAFHNLLYRTWMFFREDQDTTVISDAFPLLTALKDVHVILAEGAQNQYAELGWKAREDMLMMQWLLARPEMKEFLRGRYMVPYEEPWMGAVDAMKKLQGWSDVSETQFRYLAAYGERILLSIRYGNWIKENNQEHAKNWARFFKPDIQSYTYAYQAVTGVDLTAEITDARQARERYLQPSMLLRRQLSAQQQPRALESQGTRAISSSQEVRYLEASPVSVRRDRGDE